ncbi:MAG TPA: AAA family ATPase [Ktedonobacteraceae bacterium]
MNDTPQVRPAWLMDLITFQQGRIARQFVLHFNITDYIIDLSERLPLEKGGYTRGGSVVSASLQPQTLREYLDDFLFDVFRCQTIYTYSLANGLTARDARDQRENQENFENEYHGPGMQRIYEIYQSRYGSGPAAAESSRRTTADGLNLPTDVSENLKLLGQALQRKYLDPLDSKSEKERPVAVILDYAEKLIPFHLGEGQGEQQQLQALEVVQRWALDHQIRDTENIILLLTTNIGQIPSSVYAEGSGCRAIRIPLPDEHERSAFIHFKMSRSKRPRLVPLNPNDFGLTEEEQAGRLARATQGMRLTDIDNLSRRIASEVYTTYAYYRNAHQAFQGSTSPLLLAEDVQRVKAEVIQAQSAALLEIVPPKRSFDEIGGLENLKQYLRKRTRFMLSGEYSPLVPSGLLLAGPPGTGKTIIAEALARESGFNLVKMRNIQDKWVGSSERNLELVLNLLKDLHPVVVFIDEIDQAMVRRDTGQSGDSGVGARMFARLLEEMSSGVNRGKILWVAATNRADILDEALLRRFDRVVPLLVPDSEESCRIMATLIDTIVKQSEGRIQISYGGDLAQSGKQTHADFQKFANIAKITTEMGLTGASIEIVLRRAIEIVHEELAELNGQTTNVAPILESRHLFRAVRDFKPNYQREVYEYQSLLAIRACNFYSVIPTLPKSGAYARILGPEGTINVTKLEEEIRILERFLRR